MRPRTVAVLAAVVVALGAFLYFVDRDLPSSEERAERARKLLRIDRDEIDGLALRPEGAEAPIELVRGEGVEDEVLPPAASRWQLVAPLEAAADDGAVERLLSTLEELEKERTLERMPRADAGLAPPRAAVTLAASGSSTTLEIGTAVPGAETVLVALAGGDEVFVVGNELLEQLDRSVERWRNRRLFPARREDIESVRLVRGEREVVLARRGGEMWLEKPLFDRVDRELGNELLSTLVGLEATAFLDRAPAAVGAAAGGLVAVELAGRDEPWRIELGSTGERAGEGAEGDGAEVEVAARVGGTPARLRGLLELVQRSAADWRSRALLAVPVYGVDRMVIRDGDEEMVLERREGDWLRDGTRVSFATINDLLYELDDLRAIGFASAADRAAETADEAASLVFVVTSGTTAATAEADGEVTEIRLVAPSAETILAQIGSRPEALRLEPGTLAALQEKVAAIRSAEPLAPATAGDESGDDAQ